MKIAITGGTGFIGKWLLKMVNKKHECIVLGIEPDINKLYIDDREFQFVQTDFSTTELLKSLKSIEAIVHLAGIRPIMGMNSYNDFYENVRISENLFKACKTLNISNLVFASTGSIYSPTVNLFPFSENEAVFPPSFYALSKLSIENLGNIYDLNIKSLRFAHVIGHGERKGYMVMTFINRAIHKEPLIIFGEGKGKREYIYVKDVSSAIIAALNKPEISGVFNIGMGYAISHRQFAESICEVFADGDIEIIEDKTKVEDTANYLMDERKAKDILKWKPKYSLNEALLEMKNYF